MRYEEGRPVAYDSCADFSAPEGICWDQWALAGLSTPFIGYAALAEKRTDQFYQNIINSQAEEWTTKWIQLESSDEELVTSDQVKEIETEALDNWQIDSFVRDCWADYFGWDGGGLVFIDIKGHTSSEVLQTELILDEEHIGIGDLVRFHPVEAINCYPQEYDTANPLSPNFYEPMYWNVWGQKIHRSRFLHFKQNTLPYLLRPAYNFFGIPLIQLLQPYREGFERARLASLESIDNHSLLYLKADLSSMLQVGCNDSSGLQNRVKLMQLFRSNSGIAIVNRDTEDFAQINTPLTDLAELVNLNLEMVAMMTRRSVTKMFGTPPRGFNSTGENYRFDQAEIVEQQQKKILHDNVVRMYQLIMLNKWGKVFKEIKYSWKTTFTQSPDEALQARERQATIDNIYVNGVQQVLTGDEVRRRLASDPESGYYGIYVEDSDGKEYYEEQEDYGEISPDLAGFYGSANGSENLNRSGVSTPDEASSGQDAERDAEITIRSRSPRANAIIGGTTSKVDNRV